MYTKFEYYSGPVSKLGLDSLVIPMFPDLSPMIMDDYTFRVLSEGQFQEEDIIKIALENENRILNENKTIFKNLNGKQMPFFIPPGSAHVFNNPKKALAANLIYTCSMDIRDGEAYFGYDLLKDCLENSVKKAQELNSKSLGILNLRSKMFADKFSRYEVYSKTEDLMYKIIEDLPKPIKLENIYYLGRNCGETNRVAIKMNPSINPEAN